MQPGVIIEPAEKHGIDVQDFAQVSALRNLIWSETILDYRFYADQSLVQYRPAVEVANKVTPAFSKIFKEMILFTSRDKPLPQTPKFTIMKKAAWALYAKEIDDMWVHELSVIANEADRFFDKLHKLGK